MDEHLMRSRRRLWLFTFPFWFPIFAVGEFFGLIAGITWHGIRCGFEVVQLVVGALPNFKEEP